MILTVGDVANDIVVQRFVDRIDPHSDTPAAVHQTRGGSAANVAAISARLGRPARFIGPLGADATGATLVAKLHDEGVEVVDVRADRSVSIVVLVDPRGGRQFLTDRPETVDWDARAEPAEIEALLSGVDRVHLTGYALCDPAATTFCERIVALAQRRSLPISIDPSSVSVLETFGVTAFQQLVDRICPDLFLPNTEEAALMGSWSAPGWTVTSNGAAPTVITERGEPQGSVEVIPTRVVDTTGAGDALAAGMLAAIDRGTTIIDAVGYGHDAARRVIGGPGADFWASD